MTQPRALFETVWVHVFEEDTPEGAVYRPVDGEVPRSRRPRERLSFSADGSARLVVAGPDDRLGETKARWTEKDGEITVTPETAVASVKTYRVRVLAGRLLVR